MRFQLEPFHRDTADDELLADLCAVANKLRTDRVTIEQYNAHGRFHSTTLTRRFGIGWLRVLERAGLKQTRNLHISDEQWFANLEGVWEALGRQPRYHEMRKPLSKYSAEGYANRFGSWLNALKAFVDFVEANGANEGQLVNLNFPLPRDDVHLASLLGGFDSLCFGVITSPVRLAAPPLQKP